MIDVSNYSCDKCSREFSRHCKHCLHTSSEVPTKFKPKKKVGCQTPKFRKPTSAPKPKLNQIYATGHEYKPNTIEIGYNLLNIKSYLKIGNMIIYNTKHFNWFHRKMWKLFFGFEIENVEE